MIDSIAVGVLIAHYFLLLVLCVFGLHRLTTTLRWIRTRRVKALSPDYFPELPRVTVQIPIYNERFVADRIIDSAVALDYPVDKLEIQIVDDSTDDTYDIVAEKVRDLRERGVNISHCHRVDRKGYKAGALKEAMAICSGEFIAIFDADFVPAPDFIHKTIHSFTDKKVAMVQTRWEHLNRESNRLTSTQAIMLDAHFGLEQNVRCLSGQLLNFNGTAGVWRKAAIIDAGNWSADTLTEDLDLSYRAQLIGWKMHYLNDVCCPAELPSDMNAFKSQQHRWAKGGTQVMLKLLKKVWRSKLPFSTKVESSFHLVNNLAYLVMLTDSLLFLVPSLFAREHLGVDSFFMFDVMFLLLSSFGHLVYLYFGQVALGRPRWHAFFSLPNLLLLGIHLAYSNARAGLEALLGRDSAFVRTPKNGEKSVNGTVFKPASKKTYQSTMFNGNRVEALVAVAYSIVACWVLYSEQYYMLPFLVLLIVGFSGVFFGRWLGLLENETDAA